MEKIRLEVMARLGLFIFLLLAWGLLRSAQGEGPLILSLGEDSYLPKSALEASTGAKFIEGLGDKKLEEIQVVILSNIGFTSLPDPLRDGLVGYLQNGGALLITGGARSFGSGGYGNSNLAGMLPFQIMYPRDWQPSRMGDIVPIDKSHPVFSGVDFLKTPLVNQFNNLGQQPGAHGVARFVKFDQQPLISERNVGAGLIFGIAFNMAETSSFWPQEDRFCLNLIRYLLQKSAIPVR